MMGRAPPAAPDSAAYAPESFRRGANPAWLQESYYQHDEGNSDSHVKTSLVGNSVTVLIEAGRLALGRWQGIYFCEFDGPRERKIQIKIVSFGETEP